MRQCPIAPGFAALLLLAGCAAHQGGESASSQPDAAHTAPAAPVSAQPAEPPSPAASPTSESQQPIEAAPAVATLEEVIITGRYIRGTAEDSALPVAGIGNEELQQHGSPSSADLMNVLPMASVTATSHPRITENITENYGHFDENPRHLTSEQPVSTLSIDVDTGAYANVRRYLLQGKLPPQDAVRIEEMLNYFDYQYAPPTNAAVPFSVATEIAPTPWNPATRLLKLALQGRMI